MITEARGSARGERVKRKASSVRASTSRSGKTSVIEGVFYGTFESGDTALWSQTVGGS